MPPNGFPNHKPALPLQAACTMPGCRWGCPRTSSLQQWLRGAETQGVQPTNLLLGNMTYRVSKNGRVAMQSSGDFVSDDTKS